MTINAIKLTGQWSLVATGVAMVQVSNGTVVFDVNTTVPVSLTGINVGAGDLFSNTDTTKNVYAFAKNQAASIVVLT